MASAASADSMVRYNKPLELASSFMIRNRSFSVAETLPYLVSRVAKQLVSEASTLSTSSRSEFIKNLEWVRFFEERLQEVANDNRLNERLERLFQEFRIAKSVGRSSIEDRAAAAAQSSAALSTN